MDCANAMIALRVYGEGEQDDIGILKEQKNERKRRVEVKKVIEGYDPTKEMKTKCEIKGDEAFQGEEMALDMQSPATGMQQMT